MGIIRDLDKDGNLVEPSSRDEHIALWKYCYRNVRHHKYCYRNVRRPYGIVDCRLVELGMFGRCDSSLKSESDSNDGAHSDSFFPSVFPRNVTLVAISDPMPKDVREVGEYFRK